MTVGNQPFKFMYNYHVEAGPLSYFEQMQGAMLSSIDICF